MWFKIAIRISFDTFWMHAIAISCHYSNGILLESCRVVFEAVTHVLSVYFEADDNSSYPRRGVVRFWEGC